MGWLVPWLPLVTLLSLGLGAGGIPYQLPHPGCSCRLYFWCAGRCQFCPAGWVWDAGRCYYFSSAKKSWEQSREDCCSKGAQLVTIRANTTLVSAPSLACPSAHGHLAVLVTTSRSLSSHPAITRRVSAPWLWPACPKPSQASRQGAGDAVPVLRSPHHLMVWLGLGVPPGSSCRSSPVLGFPGAHSQHEGVPRGTEEGWLQV